MKHRKHYPARRCPAGQRGVTLIEIMVALSLLAILVLIGVPSFQSTLERSRLKATQDSLQIAFLRARSEAAKRNSSIRICPIRANNRQRCRALTSSDTWHHGWLLYYNGDLDPELLNGATTDCSDETVDCLISIYENPNKTICVNSGRGRYAFSPGGTVSRSANVSSLGDAMELCNGRATADDKSTRIVIGLDGRFSTSVVNAPCSC